MKCSKVTFTLTGLFGVALIATVAKVRYDGALNPKYQAALYYAHIKAIDDQTSEPITIEIKWDYELISPYYKGSGPSIIETHADKSVTIALVGKRLESGLRIGIAADGYQREGLELNPDHGGIVTTESSRMITEVRLRRTTRKDNAPSIK